jgi:hypothetical protein
MSAREQIQNQFVQFIKDNELDQVYGAEAGYHTLKSGGKIRVVTFCRARTLDGTVEIYSPNYIRVRTMQHGAETFGCVADAMEYMKARFVDYDTATADSIPRKA